MFTLPLAIVALLALACILDGYSPRRTPYGLALALWSGLRSRAAAAHGAMADSYRSALATAYVIAGTVKRRARAVRSALATYRVEIRVMPRSRRSAGRKVAVNLSASGLSATVDGRPVIDTRDREWWATVDAALDRRVAASNARAATIAIVLGTWLLPLAMLGG